MFIEFHILQNFAPSNLNRDDTNTPKDCIFGGYRRARISSQCLKRAIRGDFPESVTDLSGIRTKYILDLLKDHIEDFEEIEPAIRKVVEASYSKFDKKQDSRTEVLLFLGKNEIENLATLIEEYREDLKDDKKGELSKKVSDEFKKAYKNQVNAPDIALFGRMVASNANLNIDASCQVAHAISTNKVDMEWDFWTAVDDFQKQDETGAGMMGVQGFNSSCFYRYAVIDTEQLKANLEDTDIAYKAIEAFYRASLSAVPTGKQNSMAAHNPPSFVFAVVKDGKAPWSLANAFEKPVMKDYVNESIQRLDEYWGKLVSVYGGDGILAKGAFSLADIELSNIELLPSSDRLWDVISQSMKKDN